MNKSCYIGGDGSGSAEIIYVPVRDRPISIACTIRWFAAGVELAPSEALQSKWASSFRDAEAHWFLPLVKRMAEGEAVSIKTLKDAHQIARRMPLRTVEEQRAEEPV